MNMEELRAKSEKELRETAGQLKEKTRDLRFQLAAGKAKNVREIRLTKKKIAKILTVMKEKQKV
jgi:large subunit ribosomal protein L29